MDIPQERKVVTEIPGPRSREWFERRATAVPQGVFNTHPIVTARASGAIIEDVDGNRLIDFATGISVPERRPHVACGRGGRAAPARARHPHVLPRDGERALHRARRAAERARARRRAQEDDVRELGRRGRRERGEDRAQGDRASGDRDVRPRVPRPDAARDVAHREGDAVQAGHGPVRARDLPAPVRLPVPVAGRSRADAPRRRSTTRARRSTSTSARRTSPR